MTYRPLEDPLTIADKTFTSRLLIGSAQYPNNQVMLDSIAASGAQIVTVAIRRIDLSAGGETVLDLLEGDYHILPNTAGCFTAKDAVLTAELAREALIRDDGDTDTAENLILRFRDSHYATDRRRKAEEPQDRPKL